MRRSPIKGLGWAAWILAALPVLPGGAAAQQSSTGTILGRARDTEGAAISSVTLLLEREGTVVRGAESDRLGFFRMSEVQTGNYTLRAIRLGYREVEISLQVITGEMDVEVVLERAAIEIEGVSVEAEASRERRRFEESAGATVQEISLEEIRRIPGLAEPDPIRAVEVLPGVISTSDVSAAFHVRGGASDQNLILLDGVPIFSPFHLGGFFSVFNPEMVERAELQSGGFSAAHGGRVSSVLTVDSDPGDGGFRLDGGISLLSTRLAAGGGLSSAAREGLGLTSGRWRVSARRSYFDLLFKPFFAFPYHLTDLQGVFEGWTAGGDRIEITSYHGRDAFNLTGLDDEDFPLRVRWSWGNDLVGARWTRPRRRGGSLSFNASFSRFGSGLLFPDFGDTDFSTSVNQWSIGSDLDLRPSGTLRLAFGGRADRSSYDNLIETGGTVFGEGFGEGWLVASYAQADWQPAADWLVELGVRADRWQPTLGDDVTEFSPRVAVKRFLGGRRWALRAAAGRYTQFIHSIRDEELPLGLDIWVLSGDQAPHVVSDQLQVGLEAFPWRGWQLSAEAYYRDFDGVTTFNPAEDPNEPTDDLLTGEGTSYGADLLIRRTEGEVRGWLTLSLLRAERSFEDVLSPLDPKPVITYPPLFDRRLDVDLVLQFPFFRGWDAGIRWNLGTGVPYTRAVGNFAFYRPKFAGQGGRLEWVGVDDDDITDGFGVLLGERNGFRYPTYHRLDLTLRKDMERSWGTLSPYLNVLNLYNRKNVLFYFFEYDRTPPTRSGISMFPLLPTIGVEITVR